MIWSSCERVTVFRVNIFFGAEKLRCTEHSSSGARREVQLTFCQARPLRFRDLLAVWRAGETRLDPERSPPAPRRWKRRGRAHAGPDSSARRAAGPAVRTRRVLELMPPSSYPVEAALSPRTLTRSTLSNNIYRRIKDTYLLLETVGISGSSVAGVSNQNSKD